MHRAEIWFRRGGGLRAETPGQVIVEDGINQWSWQTAGPEREKVVLRQLSPGFFNTQLPGMLGLSDVPPDWTRIRTRELDREVDGRACQGFTLSPPDPNHNPPAGGRSIGQTVFRGLVLAEQNDRIHEITVQAAPGRRNVAARP